MKSKTTLEDYGWSFRSLAFAELAYAAMGALIGVMFAIGETLAGATGAALLLLWIGLTWIVGGEEQR